MTNEPTANQLAEKLEQVFPGHALVDDVTALLRTQAAEIERLKAEHSHIVRWVVSEAQRWGGTPETGKELVELLKAERSTQAAEIERLIASNEYWHVRVSQLRTQVGSLEAASLRQHDRLIELGETNGWCDEH